MDKTFTVSAGIIVGGILLLAAIVASYHNGQNELRGKLIEQGATPAQLICAFNPPVDNLAKREVCGGTL